jgi:hypothetical protein
VCVPFTRIIDQLAVAAPAAAAAAAAAAPAAPPRVQLVALSRTSQSAASDPAAEKASVADQQKQLGALTSAYVGAPRGAPIAARADVLAHAKAQTSMSNVRTWDVSQGPPALKGKQVSQAALEAHIASCVARDGAVHVLARESSRLVRRPRAACTTRVWLRTLLALRFN